MDSSSPLGPKPAQPPVEVTVLKTETILGADRYRVEVSGWDEEEMFFVEKSHLDWDEFAGKHVTLRHMLPEGAVVFVRMLQPTAMRQSPPMVYKVEFIGCDPEGMHQFRLNAVRPRVHQESQSVN